MQNNSRKLTSVVAFVCAVIGLTGVAKQVSAEPQLPVEDKAPLVLEHGALYHWTDGGTHWSHGSHSSHSSHYSSR